MLHQLQSCGTVTLHQRGIFKVVHWYTVACGKHNAQRSVTGFYAKPTNYTSVGVLVGGHEALLSGNQ